MSRQLAGSDMFDVDFLGFPRRTCHVLLPSQPLRAAQAGLALYDSTLLHQRVVRTVGSALIDLRLHRLFHFGPIPGPLIDRQWWVEWRDSIAVPVIGPVTRAAFRFWEGRALALLMTDTGHPRGFVKVWPNPPGPPRPIPCMQPVVLARLAADPPSGFRVPSLLAEGVLGAWAYQLFEPLPPGPHRPLAAAPQRIGRIVDEWRERLADVPRPPGVASHHVIGHGDFTPRNARHAGDDRIWVLDWEYAGWAPTLADELQFWTTHFACRPWSRPARDGLRTLTTLRQRGGDADIADALRWGAYMTPGQRVIARVLAREIGLHDLEPAETGGGAHA